MDSKFKEKKIALKEINVFFTIKKLKSKNRI